MRHIWPGLLIFGILFPGERALADWSPAKRITWTSGLSIHPAIAIDPGKTLHVVWYDNTPGNSEIYYKRSTDGGSNWSAAQRLTWTSGESSDPAIAIGMDNAIHVVWEDATPGNYESYYRRSTDGGSTWNATQRLTWTSDYSRAPAIAVDADNRIHIVWWRSASSIELYYRKSTDGGSTWNPVQRLTWVSSLSYYPALAADSNQNVRAVWYCWMTDNYEVFYKHSTNGGSTWSPARRLTWNSGSSCYPDIAVDSDGVIHVVWMDKTPGNNEIYHARSSDGGSTWSDAKRVTWAGGECFVPAMAIDASNEVHVVWYNVTADDYQLYYKKSTDKGLTWTSAQKLTWGSGTSLDPAMAIDSAGTLHVVWRNAAAGNFEIYYKNWK